MKKWRKSRLGSRSIPNIRSIDVPVIVDGLRVVIGPAVRIGGSSTSCTYVRHLGGVNVLTLHIISRLIPF
jgi:hypothetical protein